jgi:hypothetical protein
VGGVQAARQWVGERVERDREGEGSDDRRGPRDVLLVELATAEQSVDERRRQDEQADRRDRREQRDRDEVPAKLGAVAGSIAIREPPPIAPGRRPARTTRRSG